jgi:hypothetical protein
VISPLALSRPMESAPVPARISFCSSNRLRAPHGRSTQPVVSSKPPPFHAAEETFQSP